MKTLIFCDESNLEFFVEKTQQLNCHFILANNRTAALSLAHKLGINFSIQHSKNSPFDHEFNNKISDFRADWIFCSSYNRRIPESILKSTQFGAVNFHGGLLPEWRGANILNWVLIEGCKMTGVTAHWMTAEFDEGPIISKKFVSIAEDDTALTLAAKLQLVSRKMFSDILNDIISDVPLVSVPQNSFPARYFKRRSPEDGLIDWSKSDYDIYNLIRALVSPWPGAFTVTSNGSKIYFRDRVPLQDIAKLRAQYSLA